MPFFAEHELHAYYKDFPERREKFIGLVGCGLQRMAAGPVKARSMYKGSLSKMALRWAERNCENWFVISSAYHLVNPDATIEPYSLWLREMPEEDRIAWGQCVIHDLKKSVGFEKPFLILAGTDFVQALMPEEKRFRTESKFRLYDPMPRMMMGMRQNWLRSHPVLSDSTVKEIFKGRVI